jgi:TP901 family phage tail tape measure protein
MPLQIPVTQTGLEASIEAAAKKAGRNLSINLGTNTKNINALSQPLGRITGQADEFTKSMEAANARVFAFGASVGIINGVTQAFGALVRNTIEVEKSLVEINTVLNASSDSLQEFGNKLFDVAKTTGQAFDTVAKGALELARQGLSTEETLKRINDALILSRLSGLDAQQSVEGLTAAFNSFQETGITTSQILNKLVVVSQKYSVSERDLIEGLKRSASVADQAGVSFDELVGIITTVQERTARGGAVIGNAFKTIFARIQDRGALEDLAVFGIKIQDLQGKILPATQILQNLAGKFNNLTQVEQADLAKKLGGVYQLSNLLAAVKDLSSEQSKYVDIVKLSAGATDEAYKKNAALNVTLASLINKVTLSAQQLGATLGEIGITNSLKELLNFINYIFEGFQKILGEESALGTLFKGIAQGIGNVLAGPGLAIFTAIIGKLSIQLAGFGIEALKSFFKITSTSKELQNIQGAITSTLLNNKQIQQQILNLEGDRVAQAQFISTALNEQLKTMQTMQSIAASITPDVYAATSGTRKGSSKNMTNSAGGYMPAVFQESRDISRGVGGARGGDKPVVIPNFAFGGGKKGTMVAHTGEYIVPNFAGGGSAIFNRDMVRSMGLPAGAKKIGAAGGFIPNFALWYNSDTNKIKDWPDQSSIKKYKTLGQQVPEAPPILQFPGRWQKVQTDSQIVRKYAEQGNLEKYKLPTSSYYLFPEENGKLYASSANQVEGVLSRNKSRAVEKAEEEQKKVDKAGSFTLNADQLGGIGLISPRFGKSGVGSVDTKMTAGEVAFFNNNQNEKIFPIDKNKYIKLLGIKTANTPSGRSFQQLQGDVSQLFAGGVVDLAYRLYGGTFDPASGGEFTQKLRALSPDKKQQLIPAAAQGDLFEAAGKVALGSIQNLESLFNQSDQNRPFDFNNRAAMQKMFGFSVGKGEAKRGGEGDSEAAFLGTKQVKGIITKVFNDPEYSPKALDTLKAQGAFSPEMQRQKKEKEISNAVSGFIPNFVSQKYVMDTLARIKAGTSGFSKQEQETFLNKFGAKSTGRKISLREVYDKLDGDIGISALIDKAYVAAGPTASNEDVYRVFEKQIKANPYALRGLVSKKGFIPNFADPLKEAIGREMSAGVPASQIYVDQNSSLKNAMNPMGLMVANRRDEPSSGMQGINRARKEGANPMLYGAARGFVPNYAAKIPDIAGNVKSGLGASFSTDVENAINEFGKKAIAAGGNMDKLAKALETTLKNLGANEDAAKTVADESRKQAETIKQSRAAATSEAQAKREALASKTLENQSNKKLAAQLDKIYIEYNKSQKSAADLDAAQKKAAAILQKTSLSQSSQRAIVSSTGSLAGSRSTAQPQATGDLLAKMFGLQTALSLLTGATSNTENAFATAANAITSTASSFTSVYLVFEGLKSAGGKLGSLFGAFGGKLGIYAAGAYALYEGFNLIAKNLDSTNASINNASHAMESFAKVAAGAAVNFGTLSESQKKRIQTSREGLIEGGRKYEKITYDAKGDLKNRALMQASFEGYTDELETQFEGTVDQALAVGVSYDLVLNRMRKAAESANKITAEEVENMINEFKTLAEEIAKVKPTDFLKNSGLFEGGENEKYFKRLENLSSEELDTQLGSFKEKSTRGKQDVPFLQELIEKYTPIRNLTATKEFAKLSLKTSKETKETQKEAVGAAIETANLSLLKQQLENRIAYKKALFEVSSAEEYSLELQKEMLSVGEKDRTLADYKLQSLQAAKKLTSDQADATINALKESELIQKKLEGMSPGGKIDPKEFEKLTSAAEKVSDIIREQGGYTEDAKNKTQELLAKTGLLPDQYGIILDIIKETNDELSRQAALQNKMYALSNLQKATLEAEKFVTEKRSAAITNQYDKELKLNELQKRRIDLEKEAGVLQLERRKIGGGAGSNLGIDREIAQLEKNAIKLKFDIDQKDLINQVRKTLAEAALSAGLTPTEVGNLNLQNVTTQEQAVEKAKEIKTAEKQARIDKLKAAQQEFEKQALASDYHYDKVVNAAHEFARILGIVTDSFSDTEAFLGGDLGISEDSRYGTVPPMVEFGLPNSTTPPNMWPSNDDLFRYEINKKTDNAIRQIEEEPSNESDLGDQIRGLYEEMPLMKLGAENAATAIENSLLSAGGSLTTFSNLVRGVFNNLSENIAQNSFAMLTATDPQSIIGNAVEARRNAILAKGPKDETTIAQAADSTAIYEKELEIKRAITAEDKINGEFELQKLKEILPLRMQLLEAETNSEREAIIDKIIAKEKQRLPVLERLKAAFSPTPEQRQMQFEDSLVDASIQFKDNLIDGISTAIQDGKTLSDVLNNAALTFSQELMKISMRNLIVGFTSSIGNLFGLGGGGGVQTMASGGMINGGSGNKDDVPAMLMGGEYVVNKKSVQKYGPEFLHAINSGKLGGYAKGGAVQSGTDGFYTPGTYGQGGIQGRQNLLDFATQTATSGQYDVIRGGDNYASINLEAESMRLTNFGRSRGPMADALRSAKEESFGLYQQDVEAEKQRREQEKELAKQQKAMKKQMLIQIGMAVASAAISSAGNAGIQGAKAGWTANAGQGFGSQLGGAFKGIFSGAQIGGSGPNVGGLSNWFSGIGNAFKGNFQQAGNYFKLSQIGNAEQVAEAMKNKNFANFMSGSGYTPAMQGENIASVGSNGIFSWAKNIFGKKENIDANEFLATGEDIKDPSQWTRGGPSTAYDFNIDNSLLPSLNQQDSNALPYLNENDLSSDVPSNAVPIIKDSGVRGNLRLGKYATGGVIPSTSGIDTVPAMLSGGEFIMNRAASQNIGAGNLQALNAGAGSLPTEEKTEELNDRLVAKLDELIATMAEGGGSGAITINVDSNGKATQETSGESSESRQKLAAQIKDTVMKVIEQEKRLGGKLRRGL